MTPDERELCLGEVADLLALDEGLTPWEVEFTESIDRRLSGGRDLSEKQIALVHKLWDRLCK